MRYIEPRKILGRRFETKERPDWDAVVLLFRDVTGSDIIKETLGCEAYGDSVFWGMREEFTHQICINGNHKVGVIEQCIWGGPQASILVEEIAELGISTAIGIGACGSTVSRLPKGAQVYAAQSLATDGTSKMYTDNEASFPSQRLTEIAGSLGREDLSPATAASVDAIYQETGVFVKSLIDLGTEVINMESSAFYTASTFCGVESIWLGHVSDCIVGDQWIEWDNIGDMTKETAIICKGLLERALKS